MTQIKGLNIDWTTIRGTIDLDKEFQKSDPLFRADILKDWIGSLTEEYHRAVDEMSEQGKRLRKAAQEKKS